MITHSSPSRVAGVESEATSNTPTGTQNNWNHGIYPAYSFHNSKYGYDPQFAHANWKYGKGDPKWMEQQRAHFLYLRDHQDERPP